MSQPTAMKLNLPKDTENPEEQNEAKESGALTILLGKDNHVFYYEGKLDPAGANWKSSSFSGENSIRDVIINKRKDVIARHVHTASCQEIWAKNGGDQNSCKDKDLVVVIKPSDEATYKNIVDMLDEMSINVIKRYALVDISEGEVQLIKATEAENPSK
jgi:biopolymer transport protein ExbD